MRALRPLLVLAFALALVAAGCGEQKGEVASTDLVVNTNQAGGPDYVKSVDDAAPGRALVAFVEAAHRNDARAMWNALTPATQGRLGGSLAYFKAKVAPDFVESVGTFVPGKYDVVTSARIGPKLAVASVAGERNPPEGGAIEFETFGRPLYERNGKWLLELYGPGSLTLLVPEERTPLRHVSAAIDADVGEPVLKVGVWFDGKQYPSPTEGPSPTEMTIFAEPEEQLDDGNHTLMAVVDLGDTALATSWTFVVGEPPKK